MNADGVSYELIADTDIAPAADWLLDLLRPANESTETAPQTISLVALAGRREAYVSAAVAGEQSAVAGAARGQRNDVLNRAAFSLGQLVGAGALDEQDVEADLFEAALACGLVAEDGENAVRRTIASGLGAGLLKPRQVPDAGSGSRRSQSPRTPRHRKEQSDGAEPDIVTQDEVARRFAAEQAGSLRYCHASGAWFEWAGVYWRRDETRYAFELIRQTCHAASSDESERVQREVRKAQYAAGVERFAQADPIFAVRMDSWDRDDFLLGTPAGTVELRSGLLRPARPEDGITRLVAAGPAETASCPRWLSFLDESFGRDAELIHLVQQWCGYSLTGDVNEHALLFGSGSGGNGKSVFLNTVTGILADYAVTAAMDTFTASFGDRHPTELAMLRGARLVTASETEEGRLWAESKIKQLTGGDPITARFMRQDHFTFRPTFKLTIIGNHQPVLRNVDEAMRRRLKILPFNRRPAHPDRHLEQKLKAEWPGILRWMIEGCLDWQRTGLASAAGVTTATAEYFAEQDLLAQWLEEACDVEPDNNAKWETSSDLFASWCIYAKAAGEEPGTMKRFGPALRRKGIVPYRTNSLRGFRGIQLRRKTTAYGSDA